MSIIYKEESYRIVGACFEVYKGKGCGFLEAVYQECLSKRQRNYIVDEVEVGAIIDLWQVLNIKRVPRRQAISRSSS